MQRPHADADRRWSIALSASLGVLAAFAMVALAWVALQGGTFDSSYSATQDYLWLFVGMTGLTVVAAAWILRSAYGSAAQKLHLFLVMMAGIAVIHVCGVAVLKPALDLGWSEAIALGSTVFLPFDLAKAGLATAAATLFLPSRQSGVPP
jgi:biotin transporter BioY